MIENDKNNEEQQRIQEMKIRIANHEKRKSKRISLLLNYLSFAIALIATVLTGVFTFNDLFKPKKNDTSIAFADTALFQRRITNVEKSYNDLTTKLNSVVIINIDSLKRLNTSNIELTQLKTQVVELRTEIKALEKVILDNPEKAISLPLFKQQLDNQKEQNAKELQFTKDEIARVYDINKWIIGLVFGMLVSIIVLNISNLLAKNKKD